MVEVAGVNSRDPGADIQTPFDVAAVMPTILAPKLGRALQSIFDQDFGGRIQVLIGIDKSDIDRRVLLELLESRPSNCLVTALDPGYSTSRRHGGLHPGRDGGVLRTTLSYLANSRYVAYLDDDNWWHKDHLSSLADAIQGVDWAFSIRWYIDGESGEPHCIDEWESTGVERGAFAEQFGGFVDPNCLMIDKLACEPVLRHWSLPLDDDPKGMSADRAVFRELSRGFRHRSTGRATTYYVLDPSDVNHRHRMRWINERKSSDSP